MKDWQRVIDINLHRVSSPAAGGSFRAAPWWGRRARLGGSCRISLEPSAAEVPVLAPAPGPPYNASKSGRETPRGDPGRWRRRKWAALGRGACQCRSRTGYTATEAGPSLRPRPPGVELHLAHPHAHGAASPIPTRSPAAVLFFCLGTAARLLSTGTVLDCRWRATRALWPFGKGPEALSGPQNRLSSPAPAAGHRRRHRPATSAARLFAVWPSHVHRGAGGRPLTRRGRGDPDATGARRRFLFFGDVSRRPDYARGLMGPRPFFAPRAVDALVKKQPPAPHCGGVGRPARGNHWDRVMERSTAKGRLPWLIPGLPASR